MVFGNGNGFVFTMKSSANIILSSSDLCDKFHWLKSNVFIFREPFQENSFEMSWLWLLSYTFSYFINLTFNSWCLMNNYTVMKNTSCI